MTVNLQSEVISNQETQISKLVEDNASLDASLEDNVSQVGLLSAQIEQMHESYVRNAKKLETSENLVEKLAAEVHTLKSAGEGSSSAGGSSIGSTSDGSSAGSTSETEPNTETNPEPEPKTTERHS